MSNHRILAGAVLLAAGAMFLAAAPATQPEKPRITISRQTTDITEPLLPDGTPDYIAAFNALHGKDVTPENNALLPLMEVRGSAAFIEKSDSPEADDKTRAEFLHLIGAQPMPPGSPLFKTFFSYLSDTASDLSGTQAQAQWTAAQSALWSADTYPELARYLAAQTHFFDLATEASKRAHFYAPMVAADGHLSHARSVQFVGLAEFGKAWEARGMLRAASGDPGGALADATALRRLGRLYAGAGSTIGVLLGVVYDDLGVQIVGTLAGSGRLNAVQCDQWRDAMNLPPLTGLAEPQRFDQWMALDRTILWAKEGIDLKEIPDDPVAKALFESFDTSALDFNIMLKRIRQQFEQERAMLEAPTLAECRAKADAIAVEKKAWQDEFEKNHATFARRAGETPEAYTQRVVDGLIAQSASLTDTEIRRRARVEPGELLPVLLAAAKVKAQTGDWPRSLAELVPAALPAVPADPFSTDGKSPPGYFVKDGHACIVSAGVDHVIGTADDEMVGDASAAPRRPPESSMP